LLEKSSRFETERKTNFTKIIVTGFFILEKLATATVAVLKVILNKVGHLGHVH